jgi:hypothetical protein
MAEIIVDQTDLNITITPNTTQLNVFTGGYACAQGNTTEVQFNNGGVLAGANGLTYTSGSQTTTAANLVVTNTTDLGAIGNITITGGNSGEVLTTDGSGGLSFTEIANANFAAFAGNVIEPAQPNITSVGNLSNLTVTGNVTANFFLGNGSQLTGLAEGDEISNGSSNVKVLSANGSIAIGVNGNANILVANSTGITVSRANLGSVANLNISGGNNGFVLQTDGTGNLTWTAMTGNAGNGTVGGSNTQVQYNDGGAFGGSAGFTFNKASNLLSAPGGITAVGNVQGNYIKGDGGLLSNIAGGSFISNGNSNVVVAANSNVTISAIGNANIVTVTGTGVNVAGTLNATGNANVGNLGATQIVSNVSTGTAPLVVSSTTKVTNLNADLLDGYNTATANTANTVAVRDSSGNISANYFIGNGSQLTGIDPASISNGNSNVRVYANSDVSISAFGVANVVVIGGSVLQVPNGNIFANNGRVSANLLTGTLTTASQPNITSVGTLTSLGVTGNITAGNLTANAGVFTGNGSGLSAIAGANVTGTVSSATTAGTVTIAAQPNITSVGNLTSLTIVGTTSLQQAKEKIIVNTTGTTGNINFDLIDSAINYNSSNATGNFNLNFRGNSSTTLNTLLSSNQSITCSYISTLGLTNSVLTGVQIDGVSQTILWLQPAGAPVIGTLLGKDLYTFNILKTASSTYVVLASRLGFN